MDRFENMRHFARVVETGSISAAAESLGVTKSAVSRRLKELESHLSAELFHRTTRRLNLTHTGGAFYHHCVRILDDLMEAEQSASQAHQTLKGTLRLALPLSFGIMHMSPAIEDFLTLHPQIEFDLDFNDRQVDLIEEGFDLAIRIAQLPDSSLIARRIAHISSVLCASPGYLAERGTPLRPKELTKHQCLTYSLLQAPDQWQFTDSAASQHKVKVNSSIKASNGEFLRQAAVQGRGIIYIPTFIAHEQIEQGSLVRLLDEYQLVEMNAYAIYPQTRHLSTRVRSFIDFLVDRFKGTPYWDTCLDS